LRSMPCIMNASVTPVKNKKMAGAMPPMNCEITYGPPSRKSGRANEWNTCPCSMMVAAIPRVQSRNGIRTERFFAFSCGGGSCAFGGASSKSAVDIISGEIPSSHLSAV
jgi:hypothetical protein